MSSSTAEQKTKTWDFRSDTVTKPTPEMRQAMFDAAVGDDVWGDDPTIHELEAEAAKFLGKEAALFVPSGSMGNLIAVMVHCDKRGSEMIVGDKCHIHIYEQGSSAQIAGVHSRVIHTNADGTLPLDDVAHAIRTLDDHFPTTRLFCLENTHNKCGGKVLPLDYLGKAVEFAGKHKLKLHMDGARLGNAATALGVTPARVVKGFDSVSMCLSKGLASPVGSVLAGSKDFITQARRVRKALGGGMRQAGILAACGLLSLRKMFPRMHEDHTNAKALATGLNAIDGLTVDVDQVESNMIMLDIDAAKVTDLAKFYECLKKQGVVLNTSALYNHRLVTHYHIATEDVPKILDAFKHAVEKQ